ncbi:hypothetical protein EVAR_96652_1 [Eumeta japonica]|uniref:Uncharacterized protein n=1 Tax=Eumeta variegata TaxID=151549 RepID=A0A4C2A5Y5_EUMVA|nr:hypothetical protein EVAR_96652_1 [Eumeta japonica]
MSHLKVAFKSSTSIEPYELHGVSAPRAAVAEPRCTHGTARTANYAVTERGRTARDPKRPPERDYRESMALCANARARKLQGRRRPSRRRSGLSAPPGAGTTRAADCDPERDLQREHS